MTEQIEKAGVEQHVLSFPKIHVLLAVLERGLGLGMGVRLSDVKKKSGEDEQTQNTLHELEFDGLITSQLHQTGTAGTKDRFYKPAESTCVKVFGPTKPKQG